MLSISIEGIRLIQYYESCKLKTYLCSAGKPTIGWGHTGADVKMGMVITQARADELLQLDSAIAGVLGAGAPVGSIVMWPTNIVPTGWLECNGQSTAGHAALAAIVGPTVPELRGEFIRGWDNGRGIDTARSINSAQAATAIAGTVEAYNYIAIDNGEDPYSNGVPPSDSGSPTYIARTMYRVRPRNIALMYIIKY